MGNKLCLKRTNEIILRIVDDYLLISDDVEKIQKVKDMLKLELSVNEKKTAQWIWVIFFKALNDNLYSFSDSLTPLNLFSF